MVHKSPAAVTDSTEVLGDTGIFTSGCCWTFSQEKT